MRTLLELSEVTSSIPAVGEFIDENAARFRYPPEIDVRTDTHELRSGHIAITSYEITLRGEPA